MEPIVVSGVFTVTILLIVALASNSAWEWIFYLLCALTVGRVAYRRYGPTGNPTGRQWVGVGDGGVAGDGAGDNFTCPEAVRSDVDDLYATITTGTIMQLLAPVAQG